MVDAIETTFAKQKIAEVCKLFNDIGLDATKQPDVQMPYEAIDVEMFTYAAWNAGDPQRIARGSGEIPEQHCIDVFNQMVNECPSGIDTKTYGGSKVDDCIVYDFDVERIFRLGPGKTRK